MLFAKSAGSSCRSLVSLGDEGSYMSRDYKLYPPKPKSVVSHSRTGLGMES